MIITTLRIFMITALIFIGAFDISAKSRHDKLPLSSPVIAGYNYGDSVQMRIAALGPHRIEGIWKFPHDGSTIAIERILDAGDGLTYRMVVLRSPNRLLKPGTLMGYVYPSGKRDVFDALLYTSDADGGRLHKPKQFTLSLSDESSRLIFGKVKSAYSFNLWRLLPYVWRGVVRKRDNTGEAPDGCIKIFPYPLRPAEPRYL